MLHAVRKSLTTESVNTLIHAPIASRLDYCNSVFYQLSAANRRYLRSATHGDLLVPRTRTVTYGPQSFAVSGPTV